MAFQDWLAQNPQYLNAAGPMPAPTAGTPMPQGTPVPTAQYNGLPMSLNPRGPNPATGDQAQNPMALLLAILGLAGGQGIPGGGPPASQNQPYGMGGSGYGG